MGKLRAVVYVRISRDKVGAGLGVERQELLCRELAERLGVLVIFVYSDNDISAYSGKPRPGYRQMLTAIQAGEVDLVLAFHTDRIHRSPIELEDYISICEARGVATHTVLAGPIDLATATGRMGARVYGAVARYEVEHNIERITSEKREAAKAGKWSGGGRPYAYESDGITIRESEATILRTCVAKLIAGESQASVIRWLNNNGHLTSTGKKWMLGNFQRTIIKKRYIGVREHVPEHGGPRSEYPAEWPGIIKVTDYELMMARLKEAAQPWSHGPIEGRSYLLSGLAFCGTCGAAMYGQKRTVGDKKQRRYRCRPYDNYGAKIGCGRVFRDAKALDAFITEAVMTRLEIPEVAAALANDHDQTQAQTLAEELMRLKVRRKDIARKLAVARQEEETDLGVMLETIRDAMEQTQAQLSKLQSKKTSAILPAKGSLREVWESSDIAWRRDIIKLIVGKIIVNPSGRTHPTWNGFRFDISLISVEWLA